jgi:predicted glycoside hydrolase/deacetylase ChbG (UPF0249 family)
MGPNPVLKALGFAVDDRVVIIHTDDVGMCQASLSAFAELVEFGLISSGAVMVPCPWFRHTAATLRELPQADMGVHLTLTSEWEGYRWGPVSTRDPASGLIDDEGYFYRTTEEVHAHADPAAAQLELQAQLERALAAGIDLTHIDTHMGAVGDIRLVPAYIQLAAQHRLPMMMLRLDEAGWQEAGMDPVTASFGVQLVEQLEAQGVPMVDRLVMLPLDQHEQRIELAKATLRALPPGLTHFVIHPAKDTPEVRAITPDWRSRVADYRAFTSEELRDFVRNSGLQVIGYRALRDLVRSGSA